MGKILIGLAGEAIFVLKICKLGWFFKTVFGKIIHYSRNHFYIDFCTFCPCFPGKAHKSIRNWLKTAPPSIPTWPYYGLTRGVPPSRVLSEQNLHTQGSILAPNLRKQGSDFHQISVCKGLFWGSWKKMALNLEKYCQNSLL